MPIERYEARGVSSTKEEVHAAVARLDSGIFPGAFCRIFENPFGQMRSSCLVMHTDDVGTKTSLAYLAWREGFGREVWRGIAQDSVAMNIDDAACVGATGPFWITNTIARNARIIPGDVLNEILIGYEESVERLRAVGVECHLVGGETSDCGDVIRSIFVESTMIGEVSREAVIDAARIRAGDVIVGFSSAGRAVWEEIENSGIGSNGLTSARHELLSRKYGDRYPETFAPEIDQGLVYTGQFDLRDPLPGDSQFRIGEALLSPTRTYAPLIKALLGGNGIQSIHALIHCTGGGQTKILKYGGANGQAVQYVKDSLLPVPPIFAAIKAAGAYSDFEMYKVFNMGQLLEAVVSPAVADECIRISRDLGIDAAVIGHVETGHSDRNELRISVDGHEHLYSAAGQ